MQKFVGNVKRGNALIYYQSFFLTHCFFLCILSFDFGSKLIIRLLI